MRDPTTGYAIHGIECGAGVYSKTFNRISVHIYQDLN